MDGVAREKEPKLLEHLERLNVGSEGVAREKEPRLLEHLEKLDVRGRCSS